VEQNPPSANRFVSRSLASVPASGIRDFFDILTTIDDVISLGVGEPDYVTPQPIRQAAIESIENGETHYTSNYGLFELREAISSELQHLYGVSYDPSTEIVITSGSSEAFDIALRSLLDDGDEVLCPDPSYVAYEPAVLMAKGRFCPVPTSADNDFRLIAKDVSERITDRTKALLFGFPANPTGATMDYSDLEGIAEVANTNDLVVISDELYARLTYEGQHTCFSSINGMRERTILIGGFSKTYAMTGWRVGWLAAPSPLAEAAMKVHQYVMMSAPTAAQYAALAAIQHGESFVQEMLADYDRRRRLMVDGLHAIGLPAFNPRGAFYVFPDIRPTGMDSTTFSQRLLTEERVAVVPGVAFGSSGEGFVRACYASGYEEIERALERIGRFVQRNR
tara:strand:- start:4478 stop:5659 length:1182 start_codon:yes stop_codon:yes gene_type:complete